MAVQLKTKVLMGFLSVALIGCFLGIFGIWNLKNISEGYASGIEFQANAIKLSGQLAELHQQSRVLLYQGLGYAKSEKDIPEYERKYYVLRKLLDDKAEELKSKLIGKEEKDLINTYLETKKDYMASFIGAYWKALKNFKKDEAIKITFDAIPLVSKHQSSLNALVETLIKIGDNGSAELTKISKQTMSIMVIFTIIGLILSIVLALWIGVYVISRPIMKISNFLKNSSGQIAISSNELSSTSQEIANGASEQAASIEETTSSMEEVSSMVKQNLSTVKESTGLSEKVASESQNGYTQMEKMLESMSDINKSANQIRTIIQVIDEIAFQTNILALNAAVEAARAGEAGLGFAVVADEVKNLANKSADAAKETSKMIEESIKKTESGLDISAKMAEIFKVILATSQKVSQLSREVESSSKQQDTGINQVNKALLQVDTVVQQNASASEELASSAVEMQSLVNGLNEAVIDLFLLVTGKAENIDNQNQSGKTTLKKQTQNTVKKTNPGFKKQGFEQKKKKDVAPEKLIPFEEDDEFKSFE